MESHRWLFGFFVTLIARGFTATEVLQQILDHFEFSGCHCTAQCHLRNAFITAIAVSFQVMGMPSSAWHLCFLLLSLLFVTNRHELAWHRFFHYHTGYLLSKDEEYYQMLRLLSSFSGQMQILFIIPQSNKRLTVSLKPWFFLDTDTNVIYSISNIVFFEMIQHKH